MENQIWRACEKAPWRQNSSSSSNEWQWQVGREEQRVELELIGKKGDEQAVENYLENCADIKVDIGALASSIEPEDEEVCKKVHPELFDERRGSNIFKLFDTSEKKDNLVACRRRWLERQGEEVAVQERWPNGWQHIEYQGVVAKAPPCP